MKAFGASDDGYGLLIPPPDTPQKKNLQKEYNELRKKVFEILQSKLSEIAARMEAFGAEPSVNGLLIQPQDTPEKKELQEKYNKLRTEAIMTKPTPPPPPPSSQFMERQPLGGRTRVKRTNKNRRMRTRRSRTRRTRRTRRRY